MVYTKILFSLSLFTYFGRESVHSCMCPGAEECTEKGRERPRQTPWSAQSPTRAPYHDHEIMI